jgi:hypothetical protein
MVIVDPGPARLADPLSTDYPPIRHTIVGGGWGEFGQTSGWGRADANIPSRGGDGAPASHKVRPIAVALPTTAERSDDVVDLNATEPSTNDDAAILGPPNADGGE